MVISDVIEGLQRVFPTYAERIGTMAASYQRVLGDLGEAELRRAWENTIDRWAKSFPPMPADFATQRPAAPSKEESSFSEAVRTTRTAQTERRRLVDRTLEAYADTMAAYAKAFAPSWARDISAKIRVAGGDVYRSCAVFKIERMAWPLAVETARTGRGYQHVEMTPADWQDIQEHAETRLRAWGGRTIPDVTRSPSAYEIEQRERLNELARARYGEAREEGAA